MHQDILKELLRNKIIFITILTWVIAQMLKVIIGLFRDRKFDFRWLIGSGGMPSSHAAGVSCLAMATGINYGFDSIYFSLATTFAFIVMFDAQGVRRSTGRQARILNKVMDDIYWQGKIKENRLREFVGHTPIEVIAGFLLGIIVAYLAY